MEEALAVAMPAPASFTGEDVVELHVHAGRRNVEQEVVQACLGAGATAAGAGEFTRRAAVGPASDQPTAEAVGVDDPGTGARVHRAGELLAELEAVLAPGGRWWCRR